MNVKVNRDGVLVIEAVNEQETYILKTWMRDNVSNDAGDLSYSVNSIEIKLDDE